jgi:hypothetical protein
MERKSIVIEYHVETKYVFVHVIESVTKYFRMSLFFIITVFWGTV